MIKADDLKRKIPTPNIVASDFYSIKWRNNQARCPCVDRHNHGDKNPSLRYDTGKNRIFCASQQCFGENGADAFTLVMVMEGCNFSKAKRRLQEYYGVANGNGNGNPPRQPKNTVQQRPGKELAVDVRKTLANDGFKVVAEFPYGNDLRKIRLDHSTKMQADKQRPEKTFRWEHRGRDGIWYSGDGGAAKPLYLNRVANERDQPGLAIGFEGEAKADLAGQLGFAAFSYKEISEASAKALIDWEPVLWPDADTVGSKNATRAAELILKVGVRAVAIAQPPPDIPDAGDIVDAVQGLGWTAGDISRLIAAAKPVFPARPRGVQSISKIPLIRECGAKAVEYLIEPVLPTGAVVAIAGDSGSGKSTLVSKWAGQVAASGRPVLILDKENSIAVVLDRFERLAISDGPMLHYWGGWLPDESRRHSDA